MAATPQAHTWRCDAAQKDTRHRKEDEGADASKCKHVKDDDEDGVYKRKYFFFLWTDEEEELLQVTLNYYWLGVVSVQIHRYTYIFPERR